MSIEGQGHFFTIYFPGFVCFVLYLDKISVERLQEHWSSGSGFCMTWLVCNSCWVGHSLHMYNSIKLLKSNI